MQLAHAGSMPSLRAVIVLVLAAGCGAKSSSAPAPEAAGERYTDAPTMQCRELVRSSSGGVDASGLVDAVRERDPELGARLEQMVAERPPELDARMAELQERLRERAQRHETSCSSSDAATPIVHVGAGSATLRGRVLLPAVDVPLAGAELTIQRSGSDAKHSTTTDSCGRFAFTGLVPGRWEARFAVRTFRGSAVIDVGASIEPQELRVDPSAVRIATIRGDYDAVEVVLGSAGIPVTTLSGACLSDGRLRGYDVVFVNCREPHELSQPEIDNLRSFVERGGSLYFSDLTLPWVHSTFPGQVDVSPERGRAEKRWARATDPELAAFLGHGDRFEIDFDLGGWRRVEATSDDTRVLVAGSHPYTLVFERDRGRVGLTSFHYHAQTEGDELWSLVYFLTRL